MRWVSWEVSCNHKRYVEDICRVKKKVGRFGKVDMYQLCSENGEQFSLFRP